MFPINRLFQTAESGTEAVASSEDKQSLFTNNDPFSELQKEHTANEQK